MFVDEMTTYLYRVFNLQLQRCANVVVKSEGFEGAKTLNHMSQLRRSLIIVDTVERHWYLLVLLEHATSTKTIPKASLSYDRHTRMQGNKPLSCQNSGQLISNYQSLASTFQFNRTPITTSWSRAPFFFST